MNRCLVRLGESPTGGADHLLLAHRVGTPGQRLQLPLRPSIET